MLTRRAWIGASAAAAVAAVWPRARATAATTTPVADGLTLIAGAGGNVLALSTGEGLVLVDSGAPDMQAALGEALEALPGGGRVHTLFNTHWHHDQIGGNETIGGAGAAIIAHEKTRQRLAVGYYLPAMDRYEPPAPVKARPTESFYTQGQTTIAGRRIDYGYLLEAHTDGDCYVHFRDANVLAVGDAVSPLRDPELDWFGGGWLGGRLDALNLLLALGDARTKFVPSFGPVVGRADVLAERDMMQRLFDRFVDLVRKGDSAEDIFAAGVMNDTGRTWSDPKKFVRAAHKGFWAHHNTLSPDIV
jgi:glyoxylase-like metal-dependent hydrolase (beta-lactamase superfamily II)